jgi:hypothetical protein
MRLTRAAAVLAFVLCVSGSTRAVQMTLDSRAIGEAILIGQSRIDRERIRAHEPYRLKVATAPVDWIDVITPFHRVILAAEARARIGDRLFAQREAFAALAEAPGQIVLVVELTFHPLNNFVGVPAYVVALIGPKGTLHQPVRTDRYPRFQARLATLTPELPIVGGTPVFGKGEPVVGGTLVVPFNATALDPMGLYSVTVSEAGKELTRVTMDLAKLK